MKRVRKSGLIGIMIGLMSCPLVSFGAASGNYTDLLPIGAPGNTTVISNGTGWSLTTLPPTQTFGDALSRVVTTVYQSTQPINNLNVATTSTFTAISGIGAIGSTTLPAAWVATGRTIQTTIEGEFTTPATAVNWTWQLKLSTTAVLTTGAMAATANQTASHFKAVSLVTVSTTGASGSADSSYSIMVSSGANATGATVISFSTSAVIGIDWTSQLVVNPTFLWSATGSSITVRNVNVQLFN